MAITYIGSCLEVASPQTVPSNIDTSDDEDWEGLDWNQVGKIITIGEFGETAEDVSYDLLKSGRKTHVNGIRDVGEIPVMVEYDAEDGGVGIVDTHANSNTVLYFRINDRPDASIGETVRPNSYFFGVAANVTTSERTASTFKGASFMIRTQSAILRD